MAQLSGSEDAAYDLVLTRPGLTAAELAAHWTGDGPLPSHLDALVRSGLVLYGDGRYLARAPEVVAEQTIAELDHVLALIRQRVLSAGASVTGAVTDERRVTIEHVHGLANIGARLQLLRRSAQTQVRSMRWSHPMSMRAHLELLDRGVACRALYSGSELHRVRAFRDQAKLAEAGQESRVLTRLPVPLYVVDDTAAVMPVPDDEGPISSALIVHGSPFLDTLIDLFEVLWAAGTVLSDAAIVTERATTAGLDRHLISLMMAGLTDAAIARQLGVSQRTAQRRIAEVMRELGATNRFHAGVQAALRGLSSEPSGG